MANSTLGSANSAFLSSFQGLRLSSNVRCAGVQAPQRRRVGLLVEARRMEAGVGMFGTKCGMRTLFMEDGTALPCTIIGFESENMVAQIKTEDSDGYNSVQVGYLTLKSNHKKKVSKPVEGHLKKYKCPPLRRIREFKLKTVEQVQAYESGQQLKPEEMFEVGQHVDVAGKTIGKGFQGAIKRWGHKRGMKTHGSKSYRQHGSIGSGSATPSRVFPGMKMAGQMGNKRRKTKNLEILEIDPEYIVVKGCVPGKPGNILEVTPAKIVGTNC